MAPAEIEVITLLVDDVAASLAFYQSVFSPETIFEDADGVLLAFGGVVVNLLVAREGPTLVAPRPIGTSQDGPRFMLTVKVADVDRQCEALKGLGIALVNGPMDRPWGRRTAAFADPSGHMWELAQELPSSQQT
jgi:catechol 2,3-dioxygenase-like lactoylglutathione lyase family enzyme